jgi:phospholipase/carboxylesterase
VTFNNWTFRLGMPIINPGRVLVLLHGWKGDENSMWVLARKLSMKYILLAPRAPFRVEEGGYSWRNIKPGTWGNSSIEDLRPSVEALLAFIDAWSPSAGVDSERFDVMGFSQGATMAYALTLLFPDRIQRLVALSGPFPSNAEKLLPSKSISGKPIFVAHGRADNLILVDNARRTVTFLKDSGAQVEYCESDAGHKVSKECLAEMEKFLESS